MKAAPKSTSAFRILHLEDSQDDCELVQQPLIDVRSEPEKGTSISLFFPVPAEPPGRLVESAPDNPKSVDGTETVLIVDDEPDVRTLLEIMLKSHGYRVLPAGDAETALGMLPLPAGETGLLLSDVGLPTIDGFELSRRARQIQPRLKTILCSGYTDGRLKARMGEQGIDGFIPKPYNGNELLQTIRAVLDKVEWK